MSKTFKFKRKYYGDRQIYKKASATIEAGVTILVGCNGAGKSTLQSIMQNQLREDNHPFVSYNNEYDGGYFSRQNKMDFGDPLDSIAMCFSSEGENIAINLGDQVNAIREYINTGKSSKGISAFDAIFTELVSDSNKTSQEPISNERWIFFDAVDSGFSIDNIVEFKSLVDAIVNSCIHLELDPYIIISANSYELCSTYPCYDVMACKYVEFEDYEDYKKFILKSRVLKDKSIKL